MTVSKYVHDKATEMATGEAFNSMTIIDNGSGQYAGNVAELCFAEFLDMHLLNYQYVAEQKDHYDFIFNGMTIDVKAKQRNVECLTYYDATVSKAQKNYNVDLYVFASLLMNKNKALECQFMGWIPKAQFWQDCTQGIEGDTVRGLVYRTDSGSLQYDNMKSMEDLWNYDHIKN